MQNVLNPHTNGFRSQQTNVFPWMHYIEHRRCQAVSRKLFHFVSWWSIFYWCPRINCAPRELTTIHSHRLQVQEHWRYYCRVAGQLGPGIWRRHTLHHNSDVITKTGPRRWHADDIIHYQIHRSTSPIDNATYQPI